MTTITPAFMPEKAKQHKNRRTVASVLKKIPDMRRKQNSQLPQTPKEALKVLADNILNSFDTDSLCFVNHLHGFCIYAEGSFVQFVIAAGRRAPFQSG
ncbi:hypothetical protein GM418_23875 [Maribellus comscasis]|uniref:Uncharacterized protein n=1 Tax=Maribellus comscasis TaxID=2681766 RepID=A0A6I6K270_9BACT|nr:hypothetical protein [Maribellus comscasis]QGY46587.1 hypothetical protein GM418_23875 [Maribellus comscasis]